MSDGQTFYAILFALYILNGFQTGGKESFILRKRWFRGWSFDRPLAFLGGSQRNLFYTHVSPVYIYSIIVSDGEQNTRLVSANRVKSLIRLIERPASNLRSLSFMVFYLYFIIIPWCYYRMGETMILYGLILLALILPIFISFWFFRIHMRLDRQNRGERWKHVFYALMMPWHAMRLADYLFSNAYLNKIHPLSMAGVASGLDADQFIGQQYRDAKYLSKSRYSTEIIDKYLRLNGINANSLIVPPESTDEAEVKYCPCCHILFTVSANKCEECEGLDLLSI